MQVAIFKGRGVLIDIEALLFSLTAIAIARILTYVSADPIVYTFSILFSFCTAPYLVFQICPFFTKKEVFDLLDKSVKISLWGLFLVPIVFIPITFFSYLTHSYVFEQ